MMNDRNLTAILGRCLEKIATGETAANCLARYPEHAAELAPLLASAAEAALLRNYRLDETARLRMRRRILQAEAVRNERLARRWWQSGLFALPRAAAIALVLVLSVLLTTGVVAASQPGDAAYGVRITVERVPALLARQPESRARAELGIAERRLADLDRTMSSQEETLDERTLTALLASVAQVETLAPALPEATRTELAARLTEQARQLTQWAQQAPREGDAAALQIAARRTLQAGEELGQRGRPPAGLPDAPQATPTARSRTNERSTPAAGPTVTPTQHANRLRTGQPSATGQPTRTAQPARTATPEPEPPVPAHRASVTPQGPGPEATPEGPGPEATPQGPGPEATPQGPGPEATPQGPGPEATPQGPGPEATPQGPGPEATPQGPGPEATPQGPGPEATPQGPGPEATPECPSIDGTPVCPGPDATPQGPEGTGTPQGPGQDATPQGPGPDVTPPGPRPGGVG